MTPETPGSLTRSIPATVVYALTSSLCYVNFYISLLNLPCPRGCNGQADVLEQVHGYRERALADGNVFLSSDFLRLQCADGVNLTLQGLLFVRLRLA